MLHQLGTMGMGPTSLLLPLLALLLLALLPMLGLLLLAALLLLLHGSTMSLVRSCLFVPLLTSLLSAGCGLLLFFGRLLLLSGISPLPATVLHAIVGFAPLAAEDQAG